MKGFDIYERIGQLLSIKPYRDLFQFTYVGNLPLGIYLPNTKIIPNITGFELGDILRQHHIYVTAARNEAAGMHHVEGMRCGLPVLFLNSGALPEYCGPYGIEFNLADFDQKLIEISERYPELQSKVRNCPYTSDWMAEKYENIFKKQNIYWIESIIATYNVSKDILY